MIQHMIFCCRIFSAFAGSIYEYQINTLRALVAAITVMTLTMSVLSPSILSTSRDPTGFAPNGEKDPDSDEDQRMVICEFKLNESYAAITGTVEIMFTIIELAMFIRPLRSLFHSQRVVGAQACSRSLKDLAFEVRSLVNHGFCLLIWLKFYNKKTSCCR